MRLKSVLQEASYSAWRMPDSKNLKQEYNVEYKHHVRDQIGDIWPTYNDFVDDVKKAKKTKVSKSMDRSISNRSRTQSKEQLIRLVKGYASWPEFRNKQWFTGYGRQHSYGCSIPTRCIANGIGYRRIG